METSVKLETPASSQPEACWICELPAPVHDLTADRNAHLAKKLASLTRGDLNREHRRSLCGDCTVKLNDAYRFVQRCVEAEQRLGGDPEVKVEQEEDHFVECMVEIKPEEEEEPLEAKLDGEQEDESAQSEERRGSRKSEPKAKTFQCETCDATFDVRKDLHQHIKTHGKRRFPCKLCDRIFVRKATLQDHMNKHEGVRKYNCDKCGKTFTQRANLIRHVKNIHLNEKGFPCSYCAKQFASKNNLEVHELTHITVKNFACEQCPRAFKTEALLKRHRIVQHFPEEQSGTAAAADPDEKGAKNLPQSRVTDTRE
ncbi:oocyte zinc finger protein XlCOF19-like [Culex quinquefasciatus]|uniref:oocyte zinc finger protein XlCOF19-like n=1 Tax=Culex quinquefasciatus TaxID=7176 RepID=UPI0018E2FD5F|nr:oocyte zinc finger protein XlCOF19-like [Culex quinquefasciatus]